MTHCMHFKKIQETTVETTVKHIDLYVNNVSLLFSVCLDLFATLLTLHSLPRDGALNRTESEAHSLSSSEDWERFKTQTTCKPMN